MSYQDSLCLRITARKKNICMHFATAIVIADSHNVLSMQMQQQDVISKSS